MIDLQSLLNDEQTEISISKERWIDLKNNHNPDTIKAAISNAIDEFELPMPMRKITYDDAENDFMRLLEFDDTSLFHTGDTFTRYDYDYPLGNEYVTQSNIGNKSSDYFHQENRWKCDSINAPSPYRSWYNAKFRQGIMNALFTLKFDEINNAKLRTAIGLRKYIAAQFKPSVAKAIYNKFDSENVLDFSSGWGDRLAGFYASNSKTYQGIDPNAKLYKGYYDQMMMYSTLSGCNHSASIEKTGAELFEYTDQTYDTIFTSPPYFNIERYTQEDNQSWKKYRKLDAWLEDFLFVTLHNAWMKLERGGTMIINISDVYSNHRVNQICNPMIEYVSNLPHAYYDKSIGMKLAKRPNSKATGDGVFVEPMWIFRKR